MASTDKQLRFPVFKKRLTELEAERKRNVSEFSHDADISRATMGQYLNGKRLPDASMLAKIAKNLGVSADWLLGISDIKTPDSSINAICASTKLSETAATALHDIDDPAIVVFLNDILTGDSVILSELAKCYLAYQYASRVNPVIVKAQTKGLEGLTISLDINGKTLPKVPIADFIDYAKYSLIHSVLKFADNVKKPFAGASFKLHSTVKVNTAPGDDSTGSDSKG